jgi:hypothetical protein
VRKQPLTEPLKRRRYRPRALGGKTALDRAYLFALTREQEETKPARPPARTENSPAEKI